VEEKGVDVGEEMGEEDLVEVKEVEMEVEEMEEEKEVEKVGVEMEVV